MNVETGRSREVTWAGASEMLTTPRPGRDHTEGLARGGEKWSSSRGEPAATVGWTASGADQTRAGRAGREPV